MILNNSYVIFLIQIFILINLYMFLKVFSCIHFLFLAIVFLINFSILLSIFELDVLAGFLLCIELTGFFIILLFCLFNNIKFNSKITKINYVLLFISFLIIFIHTNFKNKLFISYYILVINYCLPVNNFFFVSEFLFLFFYFISCMNFIYIFYFFIIFSVSLIYLLIINIKVTNKIRIVAEHDINRQILRIGGVRSLLIK